MWIEKNSESFQNTALLHFPSDISYLFMKIVGSTFNKILLPSLLNANLKVHKVNSSPSIQHIIQIISPNPHFENKFL